jgi:DNA-binding transcriptional LysR family regulator
MDASLTELRVLRAVAELGSFTAAAESLGYTQSAASRQIASLETAAGAQLCERRPDGVRLTAAGRIVLRHAAIALDELEAAVRELSGQAPEEGSVRLGAFAGAGAWLVPSALSGLGRAHPGIEVSTREATSPALVRSLRAGTLDLAVIALSPPFRAPDDETPALSLETLTEAAPYVAVAESHPLAGSSHVDLTELERQRWIASRSTPEESLLGVWPGLAGRQETAHVARDWLTKLHLVAAGCGITTVPSVMAPAMPPGIRLLTVRGGPHELRRIALARLPGRPAGAVAEVGQALHAAITSGGARLR